MLLNIRADKVERAEELLKVLQHLRPEAYFKDEGDQASTDFLANIEKDLGRPLTPEERAELSFGEPPQEEFDVIERA